MFSTRTGRRPRLPVKTCDHLTRPARLWRLRRALVELGQAACIAALFTAPLFAYLLDTP